MMLWFNNTAVARQKRNLYLYKNLLFILAFIGLIFMLAIFEQTQNKHEIFRVAFPSIKLPFGIGINLGTLSMPLRASAAG